MFNSSAVWGGIQLSILVSAHQKYDYSNEERYTKTQQIHSNQDQCFHQISKFKSITNRSHIFKSLITVKYDQIFFNYVFVHIQLDGRNKISYLVAQ